MPKRSRNKRKEEEQISEDSSSGIDLDSSDELSADDDQDVERNANGEEIVNVDFDFFNLNPKIDFHAVRTFLKQLFGDDYKYFDLSSLSDIILDPSNSNIGTTIKTDGADSDPFAILTLINLKNYTSKPSLKTVVEYIINKLQNSIKSPEFLILFQKILQINDSKTIALVINERLINLPVEVMTPAFKFLLKETNTNDSDLKYFIILSKVYKMVDSAISDDSDSDSDIEMDSSVTSKPKSKSKSKHKKTKKNSANQQEFEYFHYEDIILEKYALKKGIYSYDTVLQEVDSRRVFTNYGVEPHLSLILIDKENLEKSVAEMEKTFPLF
ncbi:protein-transporting protein BCP1 ASCRUDRAFT_77888 [Ascoidea rubescens DSM 1968]|uniref:Protein BCP1 n=1 Tax=Ascoidea rubescens DSM 1968 TaxID=1344418 RepID=A0A1D2VAC3_9ASCO|nr:hypothetical protein ASCRUDRAFT_77888 [Ascoidea rubescens DSM 1968]ODV58407.1 hypothetical protein ASCRUDRAFT_77888 [Ascoidea rubescens DSM 1968]